LFFHPFVTYIFALGDEVYEQVKKFSMFSAAEAVREMWILVEN